MDSAPSPTRRIPWPQTALAEAPERAPSPKLHSHNGSIPSRSNSPVGSLRDHRPPSIVVPPLSSSFQRSRKPSNATETSTRIPATDVTLNRSVVLLLNLHYLESYLELCKKGLGFRVERRTTVHPHLQCAPEGLKIIMLMQLNPRIHGGITKVASPSLTRQTKLCSTVSF